MRFTKTVKYNYTLTEETLEKDIEGFIGKARRGNYSWDYKYDGEGLKIIKQYFRILNDKFKNEEYQECKVCYEKLILFLFDASSGKDKADFGYEDLLARITNDFDKYIKNYFICLVKTCDISSLSEKLDSLMLDNLEKRMLIKTEGMTKKDYQKHALIYFLMDLAKKRGYKEKYSQLCENFRGILSEEEIKENIESYDE